MQLELNRAMAALVVAMAVATGGPAGMTPAEASETRNDFVQAIRTASVPDPNIPAALFAITDDNPQIVWRDPATRRELLAAVFMSDDAYLRFYAASPNGTTPANRPVVWATVVPQVREFCQAQYGTVADMALRLKQYLGLDPSRPYERFVQIWVDRDNLFRPCADPETDDGQCNVAMTGDPQVVRVADYRGFFTGLFASSYQENGAPWTRLGWTYDWGNPANPVGASEFLLAPSTPYEVHSTYSIDEYCRP